MPMNLQRSGRRSGRSISLKSIRTNKSPRSAVVPAARSLSFLKKKKEKKPKTNDKRDDDNDSLDAGFKRGVENDVRMLTSPPSPPVPVGDVTIQTRDTTSYAGYNDATTYTASYTDDDETTYDTTIGDDNDVRKSKFVQGVGRLLGKHEGFQAAPEEVKTEFYESLNQVAAVNAQMESKQAEHHWRGLLLDSMCLEAKKQAKMECLEAKMDLMMLCAGDVPDSWDEQDDDDDTRSYATNGTFATDDLTTQAQEEKNALALAAIKKNVTRKFNFNKKTENDDDTRSYVTTGTLATDDLTTQAQEEKNALALAAVKKNVTRKFNFNKKTEKEKTGEQSRNEKQQQRAAAAAVEKAKQAAAEEEAARKAAARKAADQKAAAEQKAAEKKAAEQKAKKEKQAKLLSIQRQNKKKDAAKKGKGKSVVSSKSAGKSVVSSKSAKSFASSKKPSSLKSVQEEESIYSEYTDDEDLSYYSHYSDEESLYSRTYDYRLSECSGRTEKIDRKKKREDNEQGMFTKGIDWIEKIAYEDLIKTYECTPAKLCKLAEEQNDPKAKKKKQRSLEAENRKKKKKKKKKTTTANHDPLLSTIRSNMNNPDPGEGDQYQSVRGEIYDIATLKTSSSGNLKANNKAPPEPLAAASTPVNSQLKMARTRVAKGPNKYSILKRHHTAESVMLASQKSQQNQRVSFVPSMFHLRKQEFQQQAQPMVAYAPPNVPYAPPNVPYAPPNVSLAQSALSMPAVSPSPPPVVTSSVPLKGGGALGTVIKTPYGRVPEPIQTDYGRRFAPQQPPPTPTTDLSKLRGEMPNIVPKASKAVQRANKMSGYSTQEIEKKSRYAPALNQEDALKSWYAPAQKQEDTLIDRYDVASKAVRRANKMSVYSTPEIEKKSRYAPALKQEDALKSWYAPAQPPQHPPTQQQHQHHPHAAPYQQYPGHMQQQYHAPQHHPLQQQQQYPMYPHPHPHHPQQYSMHPSGGGDFEFIC